MTAKDTIKAVFRPLSQKETLTVGILMVAGVILLCAEAIVANIVGLALILVAFKTEKCWKRKGRIKEE